MSFYLRISIVVTSIGLSNPKLTTLWYCSRNSSDKYYSYFNNDERG
jgi:hypothetical protein